MDAIPASLVTAVALSAAAGKNPWVPLGLLFLLAAPASVPGMFMEPELHAALHHLGPQALLWTLGGLFISVACAESLADKVSWISNWLVPLSTMWRPFASVAVAAIIAYAVADAQPVAVEALAFMPVGLTGELPVDVVRAEFDWLLGGSLFAITLTLGGVYGWLSTIAKTGTRLVLALVPLPSLKILHSFMDDFFSVSLSLAGLAFGDSLLLAAGLGAYLVVGLFTGPLLTRLTWINFRIGIALVHKLRRSRGAEAEIARAPAWLMRAVTDLGGDPAAAHLVPCYAYRAREAGRCRAGFLVLAEDTVYFATKVGWRPRLVAFPHATVTRVGVAQSTTARTVAIAEDTDNGGILEVVFYLFPSVEEDVLPLLEEATTATGLVRVRPDSEASRSGLPGYAQRGQSTRFWAPEDAGSLRAQALVTTACAVAGGVLTAGTFIPIGFGYLLSPFRRRFVVGLFLSLYLTLAVIGTAGFAWPVAVIYAVLLNTLALRDLTRAALKARVDGYVDRRAFLPMVSERVWVPPTRVTRESDRHRASDHVPLTDAPWRTVVALLADDLEPGTSTAAS
ncbi:MAG: hypothetical protein JRH11_01210 [Deltaproteobacteria bacterium]|nr:hypothetical protein [Deltaproteobacteria bacterium]